MSSRASPAAAAAGAADTGPLLLNPGLLLSYIPTYENLLRVIMLGAFLLVLKYLGSRQRKVRRAANLQIHAAKKFKERNVKRQAMYEKIKAEHTTPDAERSNFLLSLTASELHDHMHVKHDVTCEEVVLLYSLRAMAIGALTNAVAEEFYTDALAQATVVDNKIAARKAGKDKSKPGLLEGIPISVKDAFDQKGADTTCGFAVRCFKPLGHDGMIVRLLREEGAIPFVRTNVPQGLMVPESMNIIWGVAANPWNLDRTPGGSSGGEGALLAARGSVLGVGSDIGGSLRIPAHMCGIYTLKPTPHRLTLDGLGIPTLGGVSGQIAVRPVAGPMGHSVDDLVRMMQCWLREEMWKSDPYVPKVPLDMDIVTGKAGPKKLKIGYYENDGFFDAAPACQRVVRQAVAALQELGHECVKWTPPSVPLAVRIYYGIMSADSAEGVVSGMEGEEMHDNYKNLFLMLKIPSLIKQIIVFFLKKYGQSRAAMMLQCVHPKSSEELYAYQASMVEYLASFTTQWQEQEFDVVLSPGLGTPALLHNGSKDLTVACSYTFLYNVLHYPAGVVPIGLTESHELKYESEHKDLFTEKAIETVKGSQGLPVAVQVVGLPFQDEMVLRVMKELEKKIQFKEIPDLANQLNI